MVNRKALLPLDNNQEHVLLESLSTKYEFILILLTLLPGLHLTII